MDYTEDNDGQETQPLSVANSQGTASEDTVPRIAIVPSEGHESGTGYETSLSQDELATPTPIPIAAQDVHPRPVPRRGSKALWFFLGLSLALSLLSLALNAVLIYKLLDTRQKAIDGIEQAMAALEDVAAQGFQYEYKFERTIPFSGDIPFKQDIIFPFEGTIPFKTTVTVPIDMGLIQTEIEVPVDTSVYVNTSIPIHVDETIHVDTEIPVSMTIPIEIQPGDPEIQKLVNRLREWLMDMVGSF